MNYTICSLCGAVCSDAEMGPIWALFIPPDTHAPANGRGRMSAPQTFRELADLFDKGWHIAELRADSNGAGGQTLRIELAKGACKAYTFRAPLPLRALSSNGAHGHWTGAAAARDQYRREVYLEAIASQPRPWWGNKVRVSLLFGIKDGRRAQRYQPQDVGNAVAAFKAGFDGMVDARLFPDDSRKHMALGTVVIDSTVGPWVEVTVEAIE